MQKPIIGITANHSDIDITLRDKYYEQIVKAGGIPLIIPPVSNDDVIEETVLSVDALLLTGGADHDPKWQNEEPSPLLGNVNEIRDYPELQITKIAYRHQMPILGICRGVQTMAIALGGHVLQDISLGHETTLQHSQAEEREVKTHSVEIKKDTVLYSIYNTEKIEVNSFHHQSVDKSGEWFDIVARAEDGVVEAIESNEFKPMIGVQWHPEWLAEEGGKLFSWLVEEARLYKKAKQLHEQIMTVDSHCDTPMFFEQGADFSKRDDKILVDIEKMKEGMLDATCMVAYVPQDIETNPTQYADRIFDRIEEIVSTIPEKISIVKSRTELFNNKKAGKKSIILGIENALAIGNDLSLVDHFKERGCAYFTLCHNGDNQVCDSARRSKNTWGGVSPFGEELIRKMNQVGVTVDLSHAGEKSFYDAIEISQKPVICSHSNCKSICNHERNLTDDQLRRLAEKDGVCQVNLYEGFVANNPSEADIRKVIEHLNHAVRIMGVEHVGLGSDFDGDGKVRGLKDASEMMLFTRQLLKNRYSDKEIEMIWGRNIISRLGLLQ